MTLPSDIPTLLPPKKILTRSRPCGASSLARTGHAQFYYAYTYTTITREKHFPTTITFRSLRTCGPNHHLNRTGPTRRDTESFGPDSCSEAMNLAGRVSLPTLRRRWIRDWTGVTRCNKSQ